MNVASLELCKELYELSGWVGTEHSWHADRNALPNLDANGLPWRAPAYSVGYLLRKLPDLIELFNAKDGWACRFQSTTARYKAVEGGLLDLPYAWVTKGRTPEDAACKLAIELFKQGILTKEEA